MIEEQILKQFFVQVEGGGYTDSYGDYIESPPPGIEDLYLIHNTLAIFPEDILKNARLQHVTLTKNPMDGTNNEVAVAEDIRLDQVQITVDELFKPGDELPRYENSPFKNRGEELAYKLMVAIFRLYFDNNQYKFESDWPVNRWNESVEADGMTRYSRTLTFEKDFGGNNFTDWLKRRNPSGARDEFAEVAAGLFDGRFNVIDPRLVEVLARLETGFAKYLNYD